jgi:transposase InsO family protein
MRFVFIQAHARIFHIVTMCRVLGVSKAGYYAWRGRPLCDRVKEDRALSARIRVIHEEARRRYGSPRVHQELRALGLRCGRHRVARLMRHAGLRARSAERGRVTTQSAHAHPVAPNVLARRFAVAPLPPEASAAPLPPAAGPAAAPPRTWAADITYIPTGEGWLYLAVILDLATRAVVGWGLRARLDQELALDALRMALGRRGAPAALHHSDRGSQYASRAYQALLARAGIPGSMSRVGNCWDNAVVESFFATVTKELLLEGAFPTREVARRELVGFLEGWYNRRRRHSALSYRTPVEYDALLERAG